LQTELWLPERDLLTPNSETWSRRATQPEV
jgi:hypothetical protein